MWHSCSCFGGKQHVHLGGTDLQSLCADLIPRLVLANVGQEADNLISLLQEPAEDFGRGVSLIAAVRNWLQILTGAGIKATYIDG